MKKILSKLLVISILIIFTGSAFARSVRVKPYYRQNGTYVQPHYRTSPDRNIWNNYSTRGNVNPYTGNKGYKDPYKLPSINSGYGNNSIGCKPFGDDIFGGNIFGY